MDQTATSLAASVLSEYLLGGDLDDLTHKKGGYWTGPVIKFPDLSTLTLTETPAPAHSYHQPTHPSA